MCELRKFEVLLESDALKFGGRLTGYLRTPATYQISRSKSCEKPGTSYEVDVESLLGQFGISGKVNEEDMHKHHLSMGKDGNVICVLSKLQSVISFLLLNFGLLIKC